MEQEVDCHVCAANCNGHKHYGGNLSQDPPNGMIEIDYSLDSLKMDYYDK